jgi:hypothetical protein
VIFVLNIIRIPGSNDPAAAERLVARNRVLYERIRDQGGVLYPASALPMSADPLRHSVARLAGRKAAIRSRRHPDAGLPLVAAVTGESTRIPPRRLSPSRSRSP